MGKQEYADNVDANGVAYKTVGQNIREGAKDAESVVKALQSPDITFDMQAIMNVLPFMDGTKKIIRDVVTSSDSKWNSTGYSSGFDSYIYSKMPCYAVIIGKIYRKSSQSSEILGRISAETISSHMGVVFASKVTTAGNSIELFYVVDK